MDWLCRLRFCASGWLKEVYGVSDAEKLPAFISVGNGAHAMANLSRLTVLRMTGLKSVGLAVQLIVFIDDATSALMALRFAPAETTRAYMETLRDYLDKYGRPLALYSDRHSIFRVNNPEREGELTQFTRAIKTLGIEPIHANTPQAKGRVERANQTLQDRLV